MRIEYFFPNIRGFRELYDYDLKFNAAFHNVDTLTKEQMNALEMKFVYYLRQCQANKNRIWGKYYRYMFRRIRIKTGIGLSYDVKIGKGLVIGHWGTIVVNGKATFGDDIMLTHNVTIGRDVRGKRKGVPTIGNRVVIRTGSTVVGNITIGDDVLIAPNTFVNFDVPSHSIVIGNPATIHTRDNATEGHIGIVRS